VLLHGASRYPDGAHGCNLVLATVLAAQNAWAVATDEPPSLQTLWDDALRFCVEELFGDSKSGAFELSDSRLRSTEALERLYLVAAIALLYAPLVMAVQLAGLRQQVDPHYKRGISYLKIGLRWLNGVLHKGRPLLVPSPFLSKDPQPICPESDEVKGVDRQFVFDSSCCLLSILFPSLLPRKMHHKCFSIKSISDSTLSPSIHVFLC
jgi:hypothetical protein